MSTFGSNILTSNLFPIAKPFANKITSESAIEIHQRCSSSFNTTGSFTKPAFSSMIGQ